MPAAKVKCQIYIAENMEWSFRIIRGSRIIIGPEETYKTRGGVRRAVRSIAEISTGFSGSQLSSACFDCLDAEMIEWNNRKPNGYGSKPSQRYRR